MESNYNMKSRLLIIINVVIILFGWSMSQTVIINEVMSANSTIISDEDGDYSDWIELYNSSDELIDLENWEFKDEMDDHIFLFPSGVLINPNEYLVLCKNSSLFISFFPNVTNFIGEFGFGLSGGGEPIRLFNSEGELIDFVDYDDVDPWPISPDGTGPTLELLHPSFDNSIPESWSASENNGTPGSINSVILSNNSGEITISNQFTIHPNFPNPFNPITQINKIY